MSSAIFLMMMMKYYVLCLKYYVVLCLFANCECCIVVMLLYAFLSWCNLLVPFAEQQAADGPIGGRVIL